MSAPNGRPATYRCAWCDAERPLKRTGRMPKFCSDYCRRQVTAAPEQLRNAQWKLQAAQREVERLTRLLDRYRHAGDAETVAS